MDKDREKNKDLAGMGTRPKPPFPPQDTGDPPGIEERMKTPPQYSAPHYKGSGKLEGRRALITGGDSGIGRAVAVLFAREGADVSIVFLPDEHQDAAVVAEAVANEGRKACLIPGDISDEEFCQKAVKRTVADLGGIDILVNNSAFQKHRSGFSDISSEQWDRTFRTNIYGYYYMTKAALPYLKEGSAIINTSSILGFHGSKTLIDYSATKGAILTFTKALAQDLVEKNIRVNCVAPGPVWTPLNPAERAYEEVREFGGDVPMKRPAQPEEVAPAYVFLASNVDSSYITGETIAILGGEITAGN